MAGPRRQREHPPAAVSTATNPSWLSLPSEVKVTVIAEAPTLSRAGRSVPLNFLNNKASVPLPWQTVTKSQHDSVANEMNSSSMGGTPVMTHVHCMESV